MAFLLERGHSVDFFCSKFPESLKHPNLRIVRVPYLRSPRPLRVASFAYQSARCIALEERQQGYDVIQGFSRTYYHNLYRDGSGCHADYCEQYLDRWKRRGIRKLYYRLNPIDAIVRLIERKRYVDHPQSLIIAISNFVRNQILRRYPVRPETVRVVYSGVDCERFHPRRREAGKAEINALFGGEEAGDRSRTLLFVGNDYHRKGLDLILEVLRARRGDNKKGARGVRLVIAGGDARAPHYARKAANLGLGGCVRFLGQRADVADLIAGSDVLLLPSHFDAFANVYSEALASGTPVVASSTSGAAELLRPSHGWVLEPNDASSLDRALEEFLSVKDLSPLREAARCAALQLSWSVHYRELEAIYAEVTEMSTRTRSLAAMTVTGRNDNRPGRHPIR